MTSGFAYGTGLSVVVGVPIIIFTLALVSGLASFERSSAHVLLQIEIPVSHMETDQPTWMRIKELVTDRELWAATVYLLSEFVIGTAVFALLSSLVLTAGNLLLTPLYYVYAPTSIYLGPTPVFQFAPEILFGWDNLLIGLQTMVTIDTWQVTSLPVALLVAVVGAVLMLISLQLCNVIARIWKQYMRLMLQTQRYWRTLRR